MSAKTKILDSIVTDPSLAWNSELEKSPSKFSFDLDEICLNELIQRFPVTISVTGLKTSATGFEEQEINKGKRKLVKKNVFFILGENN